MLSDSKQNPGMYQDGLYPPTLPEPGTAHLRFHYAEYPVNNMRLNVGK